MKSKNSDTPNKETWLELRRRNVNSSEVAALFGMSPYLTEYELWNIKAGELEDGFVSNDRVEAGQFLEAGIAAWAAHKLGCEPRPSKESPVRVASCMSSETRRMFRRVFQILTISLDFMPRSMPHSRID